MQTSRFVNGRGLLRCKRRHLSGLAKFFCFAFPSTRHESIIRIQNAAGCSQSKGWKHEDRSPPTIDKRSTPHYALSRLEAPSVHNGTYRAVVLR